MAVWRYLWRLFRRRSPRVPQCPAAVRDELQAFRDDGRLLLVGCEDQDQPPPVSSAHRWAERVEAFLLPRLGPGYVYRFRDRKSLPSEGEAIGEVGRVAVWCGLRVRIAALDKFLAELDPG